MIGMGGDIEQTDGAPGKRQIRCLQPPLMNQTWALLLHVLLLSLLGIRILGAQSGPLARGSATRPGGWLGASTLLLRHPSLLRGRV